MKRLLPFYILCFALKLNAQIDTIPVTGPGGWIIPSVKNIMVDNANNIWFGTTAGLKKYFGANWTTFQPSNSGLPHVNVSYVIQDNSGMYWIGTANGLAKFDGATSWTVYTTSNSMLNADPITCLEKGAGNDVWIGTASGLNKFDGTTWTSYTTLNSQINCNSIRCMQYANNQLYVGTDLGLSIISASGIQNFPQLNNVLDIAVSGAEIWLKNSSGIYLFQNGQYISPKDLYDICNLPNYSGTLPITSGVGGGLTYVGNGVITNLHNGQIMDISLAPGSPGHITRVGNYYYVLEIIASVKTLLRIDPMQLNHTSYPVSTLSTPCNQEELNINQVRATQLDRGDMFWDVNSNPKYEVPKGSGSMATFAGSIWLGGKVNGQLRTACQTYRQTGVDFWPGPLDTVTAHNQPPGSLGTEVRVNRYDIQNFINNFNSGNVQSGTFIPSKGIRYWPASDTGNFSRNKAPYIDVNHNGIYDPLTGGDYPDIKGDQMLYHVYNDASDLHRETRGTYGAMGLEIRQKSYAYTCPGIADSMQSINYTTFYEFEVINRSDTLIDSMYFAFWNDTDLGSYIDDYIGCNVTENYGYVYNGDIYDEDVNGVVGYHDYPPCFSTAILQAPFANPNDGIDNDHDGTTDEPGEQLGMSAFIHINNNGDPVLGNPTAQQHYYNFMQGKWKDGSPMKYGGDGHTGTLPTTYQYPDNTDPIGYGLGGNPGSPNAQPAWTETNGGNMPGDRRFLISSGPFQLAAKDTTKMVYAMVFTQDSTAPGNYLASIVKNQQQVKQIKRWYNNNSFPSCLALPVGIATQQMKNELAVRMYPNPASTYITIEMEEYSDASIEITDILGRPVLNTQLRTKTGNLSIEQLTSGIYFVNVKSLKGQKTFKLVKD